MKTVGHIDKVGKSPITARYAVETVTETAYHHPTHTQTPSVRNRLFYAVEIHGLQLFTLA